MPSNVKLQKGFVVGKFAQVSEWLSNCGRGGFVKIADNTTVRLSVDIYGKMCIVYTHYKTNILTITEDDRITINGSYLSVTTKRRINQFLSPYNISVYTHKHKHYVNTPFGGKYEFDNNDRFVLQT